MKKMKVLTGSALVVAMSLLAACGGGGGSSSTTSAVTGNSAVSLLITDAVSDRYSKVWVTIYKVTAVDGTGNTVTLYESQGEVVNLSELNGVAALLNTQNLAAGTYDNFQVTLADEVKLVEGATGNTVIAALSGTGQQQTVPVQGSVTIAAGGTASIAIDFDLQQFTYDPTTGLVTPVLVMRNDANGQMPAATPTTPALDRTYADVDGTVTDVSDSTSFVLQPEHGAAPITVTLQPTATVYDDRDGSLGSDTSALGQGVQVEVYGNYDSAKLTIDAVRVEIKSAFSVANPSNPMADAKVEGVVESYDGVNDVLVLDVREAKHFMPPTVLEISGISNAMFIRGSADLLDAGQRVEIKGRWNDTDAVFTPRLVEIEGAMPSMGNGMGKHGYPDLYAEVGGRVESVDGDVVTVTIAKREHFDTSMAPAATIDVDVSNAWYKSGDAQCLESGAYIEAKGAVNDSGVLEAVVVDIESPCVPMVADTSPLDSTSGGAASPDGNGMMGNNGNADGSTTPSGNGNGNGNGGMGMDSPSLNDGMGPGTGMDSAMPQAAELKGVITDVSGSLVTVQPFRVEYFQPAAAQVQVDVSTAWYEYGQATDLAVDRVVDIRGSWDGSQVLASQVEFK